jgi:hypothetical protein
VVSGRGWLIIAAWALLPPAVLLLIAVIGWMEGRRP